MMQKKKSPFSSPDKRDEYFRINIAFQQQMVDEANGRIDSFRRQKPGTKPGWGTLDTKEGIRQALLRAKRDRVDALKKLRKLQAGIPLFKVED